MKRLIERDPVELRKVEFRKRDDQSMQALWDTIEYLKLNGIDIGSAGESELAERKKIKDRYQKKRSGGTVKSP